VLEAEGILLPPDHAWPYPNAAFALPPGDVHVWRVSLVIHPDDEDNLTATLSPDEQVRAARFLSVPARKQFVAARSALRPILSRYTSRRPEEIVFRLGSLGKPSLTDPGPIPLFFNLSHSGELALVAVTEIGEIGVDVERIREMASADQLAERFFHPNEVAALRALPPDQRAVGFFNAWTRKEAFLKATGKGISYGIERVEVTLTPGEPPKVIAIDGDRRAAARWSLETFAAAPGYLGSLALAQTWERVSGFTYRRPASAAQ
jgi:4'-phosphopantetheinyl transferase